jgi:acyl dehydratase
LIARNIMATEELTTTRLVHQNDLTDELIRDAEALVGTKLRIDQWNHEATLDTIRHYAHGVGDDNPIFCDEEYAASGPWGTVIAPPTFLVSMFSGALGLGLPGIQPYGAGFYWKWNDVIRRGDRIRADAKVGPITVKSGKHAKRWILQTTQTEYVRVSDGAVIAIGEGRTARVPRAEAGGGLSYKPREPYVYTVEELEAIRVESVNEPRRGPEIRYWEDVEVGEPLARVVKGPIDLSGQIAYYAGVVGNPRTRGPELQWKFITWAREDPEKLPNNYDPAFFGEVKAFTAGHVESGIAQQVGMPGAYNNGAQTTAWLVHPVLNWMGDHGFLVELETKLERPAIFADTLYCEATVQSRLDPDLVEIGLVARNQIDTQIASGRAVVRLRNRS